MQDTKGNLMPIVLCFGEDTIFALALGVDSNPMLRQTAEHIFALSNIDGLTVDVDFVNAWVFKLLCPSVAFQHGINAIFISCS